MNALSQDSQVSPRMSFIISFVQEAINCGSHNAKFILQFMPPQMVCIIVSMFSYAYLKEFFRDEHSYRLSCFFRVHPFSAMFARISKPWKMLSRKFDTVSCKSGRLRLLLWFREILICVDLIHGFRVEFAENTWRVNNLTYIIYIQRRNNVLFSAISQEMHSLSLSLWKF